MINKTNEVTVFISSNAVRQRLGGASRVTLWRRQKKGQFPKSIALSNSVKVFRLSDIEEWEKDPEAWIEANSSKS
ncbi:MAG: AlpA family phage regulatory protein [Pseudohongiella sp.]